MSRRVWALALIILAASPISRPFSTCTVDDLSLSCSRVVACSSASAVKPRDVTSPQLVGHNPDNSAVADVASVPRHGSAAAQAATIVGVAPERRTAVIRSIPSGVNLGVRSARAPHLRI